RAVAKIGGDCPGLYCQGTLAEDPHEKCWRLLGDDGFDITGIASEVAVGGGGGDSDGGYDIPVGICGLVCEAIQRSIVRTGSFRRSVTQVITHGLGCGNRGAVSRRLQGSLFMEHDANIGCKSCKSEKNSHGKGDHYQGLTAFIAKFLHSSPCITGFRDTTGNTFLRLLWG